MSGRVRRSAPAALVLAGCLLWTCAAARPALAQERLGARVLVLPFENAQREARGVWLGEAAAILLADELNARGVAAITRAERVLAFEQLNLPTAASVSRATAIKVGQILAASELVAGTCRLDGDELTVEAHSIHLEAGRVNPPVVERGRLADLFAIFDRVARRLAAGAARTSAAPPHPPLGALENYVKGLLAESVQARAGFLEAAIKEFPEFSRARLALWEVRHEQGDHAAALAAVKPVTGTGLPTRRAQLRAGVSLLEQKDFAAAHAAFTGLVDPGILRTTAPAPAPLAPVLNNLGVTELRRVPGAQPGSATYYLTRAADADPGDADYRFNLGYAYALERNYKAAIYWLREALRRNVADPDAHHVLAVALEATGNTLEASRERDLAQQLSSRYEEQTAAGAPGKLEVPAGLERLRTDLVSPHGMRPDQAILSSAQREQQDLAAFHLDRGRRLFQREQDREALAELRRVVYLSPYEAAAHRLIGRIHLRTGRAADAVEALKISIWSEDTAAARVALAEAFLALKNAAAAKQELARALALDPASAEAQRLLDSIK